MRSPNGVGLASGSYFEAFVSRRSSEMANSGISILTRYHDSLKKIIVA